MNEIVPSRALAIVAHPDDVEYFCGGTLAKWINMGCIVSYVVATSGDKGSDDADTDISALIQTREFEQRASAQLLGVHDITFLRYPDSELGRLDQYALRGEFVRYIRKTRAEVILTHDPLVRFTRQHPDHRLVGQLVLDASFPLSTVAQCYKEQISEERLVAWQPTQILLFGTDQPNYWSDISETLELKVSALEQHKSQAMAFAGGIAERLRWKAASIGQAHGLSAAEEFLMVELAARMPSS